MQSELTLFETISLALGVGFGITAVGVLCARILQWVLQRWSGKRNTQF
jgi:hypothetical protein